MRQLLTSQSFTLAGVLTAQANGIAFDSFRVEFTTGATGTLEVDFDWTLVSSPIAAGLERAPCSFNQFYAGQCSDVANTNPGGPKPGRLIVNSLAAGNYVLYIANPGPNAEAGNLQIYLTH